MQQEVLERRSAVTALNDLAAQVPPGFVHQSGEYWNFLADGLAPGTSLRIIEDDDRAILDLVYVETEHRRKGAARTAINRMLEAFDAQPGGVEVELIVERVSQRSGDYQTIPYEDVLKRFYESFGFVAIGENDDGLTIMIRNAREEGQD